MSELDRVRRLVKKSAPNHHRKRLPDDIEEKFVDVDIESAACYAQMEDLSARAAQIAAAIDCDEETPESDDGAVSHAVWDDDSVVYHIDETRRAADSRRDDTEDGLQAPSASAADK